MPSRETPVAPGPPKILPALQRWAFLHSFKAKGRFAEYLASIDVRVCLNPHAALLGSAHFACRL